MRFHVLGIPHTITNKDYVACAFTQKVLKFCSMMSGRGHTIFHYGHPDSVVECTEHVSVVTREEYNADYGNYDWHKEPFRYSTNNNVFRLFTERTIQEIQKRKKVYDFVLAFWGVGHKPICDHHSELIVVEPGIGYPEAFAPFRCYESYAMLHANLGMTHVNNAGSINPYHVVIPNYFDPNDFEFSEQKQDYFLFLGRIGRGKGVDLAIQACEKAGVKIVIAGQGSCQDIGLDNWPSHVEYVGYATTEKRKHLMKNAKGLFLLSMFVEPFGGVVVESLMSGTPVITNDWGAMTETNLHGITGYRCRTFDSIVWAIRNIENIQPKQCREWAERNYSTDRITHMYEDYFDSLLTIYVSNGFYHVNDHREHLNSLDKYYPNCETNSVTIQEETTDNSIDHVHMIFQKVHMNEPIAVIRPSDGEYSILCDKSIATIDGWKASPETKQALDEALHKASQMKNMFFGIPCKDCSKDMYKFYKQKYRPNNLTYANVFCNKNIKATLRHIKRIQKPVYYIGPGQIPCDFLTGRYTVSPFLVNNWSDEDLSAIEKWVDGREGVFLVSMGPLAKIIIPRLFEKYPHGQFLDIGSVIDPLVKKEFNPRPECHDVCCFKHGHTLQKPDITCVLTVYKRPQHLLEQIEAVRAQTIPPEKIIIWVNGTKLPDNVPSDVTVVRSSENFGVWARFSVALLGNTKYTCVFDDDTIPAHRWFENCYETMCETNGLLGTVGFCFGSDDIYAHDERYFGWANPNENIEEVDVVGHSWFFKTEWLHHLWSMKPDYTKMLRSGEDMSFTCALRKVHIGTYVPPHPSLCIDMFGSNQTKGLLYGTDAVAISSQRSDLFTNTYKYLRLKHEYKILKNK